MTKIFPKISLAVLIAIVATVLYWVLVHRPIFSSTTQLHDLKLADEQAKLLTVRYRDDPHFEQINFNAFDGLGGCLKVSGRVQSEDDIRFLTNAIESMNSPVAVDFELLTSNQQFKFAWYDQGTDAPALIRLQGGMPMETDPVKQ
jgi:hypothetical protein